MRVSAKALAALLLLTLLSAGAAAQPREPRFVGVHLAEGDPVGIAVGGSGRYTALATSQGVVFLDAEMKPVWRRPHLSLVGVAVTGPDVARGPRVLAATADRLFLYDAGGELLWSSAVARPVRSVGITPDGSRIVIAQDSLVEVRNSEGGLVWKKEIFYKETRAAIQADGRVLALADTSATLFNADGTVNRTVSFTDLVTATGVRRPHSVAAARDHLLVGFSEGTYLHQRPDGTQVRLRGVDVSSPLMVQVSSNLIAVAASRELKIRDFVPNLLRSPAPGGLIAAISLTPDGRFLAVATQERKAFLYDLGGLIPSFLAVNSTPPGTVRVDGQPRGDTPLRLEISPGPHRVVVNNSTLGEVPVTVVVPFGGEANLSLNLSRLAFPAALEVNTEPPGAEVHVDGALLGEAPITVSLTAGSHTLRVALSGYAAYISQLNLSADNLTRVNVTLASGTAATSTQEIPEGSAQEVPPAGRETTWGITLVSPAPVPSPTPTEEVPGFGAALGALALLGLAAVWRRRRLRR